MTIDAVFTTWSDAATTALGFFWKSGWAFVLGYAISAMIQAFVPKKRLMQYLGNASPRSVALSTLFGAASSSCSFAALAAARSLVQKGAHFVAAVAFMFASTNLVIELGILIFIFLGWQYVVAEVIGGLVLIVVSSILIRLTYPDKWLKQAREKVEAESTDEAEDFDWRKRIRSRMGWQMVGHSFVMDWQMVWKEILIGFTVAGFVAVAIPKSWWTTIFLVKSAGSLPGWLIALENALLAPFVAGATFIGSMGNIPLATVLAANGVLFAGIMGFIYSDLMVPPLVAINAKYYGRRVALYIAGVMYVSIVVTALTLDTAFAFFRIIPQSTRKIAEVVGFSVDYTFWLNCVFVTVAVLLVWLYRQHVKAHGKHEMKMEGDGPIKKAAAGVAALLLFGGMVVALL